MPIINTLPAVMQQMVFDQIYYGRCGQEVEVTRTIDYITKKQNEHGISDFESLLEIRTNEIKNSINELSQYINYSHGADNYFFTEAFVAGIITSKKGYESSVDSTLYRFINQNSISKDFVYKNAKAFQEACDDYKKTCVDVFSVMSEYVRSGTPSAALHNLKFNENNCPSLDSLITMANIRRFAIDGEYPYLIEMVKDIQDKHHITDAILECYDAVKIWHDAIGDRKEIRAESAIELFNQVRNALPGAKSLKLSCGVSELLVQQVFNYGENRLAITFDIMGRYGLEPQSRLKQLKDTNSSITEPAAEFDKAKAEEAYEQSLQQSRY